LLLLLWVLLSDSFYSTMKDVWEFDVDFQAVPNLKDVENLLTPPCIV